MSRNTDLKTININYIYENYGWLLKILGHQIEKKSSSIFSKIVSFVWLIMMHSYLLNLLYIYNVGIALSAPLYFEIVAACSCSIMVWYFFKCKILKIKNIIFKIHSMEVRYNFKPFKCQLINFFLVTIFCFSVCFISLDVYYLEFSPEYQKKMFTFNTEFHSNFAKVSARLYAILIYFVTVYTSPLLFSLLCCLMHYHLSKVIFQWTQKLQTEFRKQKITVNAKYIIQVFNQLSDLFKLSNKLDEILSPISFFLLSLQILLLFCNTVSIVTVPISEIDFQYKTGVFLGTTLSLTGITSIIISASLIEKRCLDIKKKICYVHDMYIHYQQKDTFILEIIRYMIYMKVPVMTVLSGITLKQSLILSCIGISLSFGLLSKQLLDKG